MQSGELKSSLLEHIVKHEENARSFKDSLAKANDINFWQYIAKSLNFRFQELLTDAPAW